jgi:2-methylcitrate dehydratase
MSQAGDLAKFVTRARFADIPAPALAQLKLRVLDSLGCAIAALDGQPIKALRSQLEEFGGVELATAIGSGQTSPAYAAWYNTALTRYLDFMDAFLVAGETCHPSDNLGSVMAAVEYRNGTGRDFLTALAVAYQVQCRLCWEAPLQHKGFDHVTQLSYSIAAGVSSALGLSSEETTNAIGMCGASLNALWVTRTGQLSQWKGLASSQVALAATNATFLAMRGISGPETVIEGKHGFNEAIAGAFEIDWAAEGLDIAPQTVLKSYNAEVHAQPVIEGLLELAHDRGIDPSAVLRVEVEAFRQVLNAIGGGEAGDKLRVQTKEHADHNLRYLVAVALLDGDVQTLQFWPDRITRSDVQDLMPRIWVRQSEEMNSSYPKDMRCRVTVLLRNGTEHSIDKHDYVGFNTRPMTREQVVGKFHRLAGNFADKDHRAAIVDAIDHLEDIPIVELTTLLREFAVPKTAAELRDLEPAPGPLGGERGLDAVVEQSFPASDPPAAG